MKHILLILFSITVSLAGYTQPLAERADSAYSAENYKLAVQLYKQAISEDGVSSTLYYNLGNAEYRCGNLSGAIINYNRALKLNPSNEDAKANLEFVNDRIIDKQIDEQSLTQKIDHKVVTFTHADNWAVLTLICFIAMLCTIAAYLFITNVGMRKFSFFAAIFFLVMTVLSGIISYKAAKRLGTHNEAIITAGSVQLSTSPREPQSKSEEAVLLHEGTKIKILDSVRVATDTVSPKWYEVEFRQGQRAWINAKNIEAI